MKRIFGCLGAGLILTGCVTNDAGQDPVEVASDTRSAADVFMSHLQGLCGQAFEGKVISQDEVDADWRSERLVMHVRDCSSDEIRIPLHVGENRSRTWIISKTDTGLRLKHDHRHEDGQPDAVTMYGGDTQSPGTDTRQAFPADDYSKDLCTL